MKVLWFTVTPSLYDVKNTGTTHNGGGWIASLERIISLRDDVELAIAFEHEDLDFCKKYNNVSYYPISVCKTKVKDLKRKFFINIEEKLIIPKCMEIIDDFNPEVIHIFGSEWTFGLVSKYTNIPVVIHMQGSIPPYFNAYFPPGYSITDFFMYRYNLITFFKQLVNYKNFRQRSDREQRILKICNNYMGRTSWDKNITQLYNPSSHYYYCSEVLRTEFTSNINPLKSNKIFHKVICSTISPALYKGFDVILKTAKLLKENTTIDFEWKIFGSSNIDFHEWKQKIKASDVNVLLEGTKSAEELKNELLNADIYVHPSYIDNSPNSICEAQYLGIPVIATDVGGISSLVKHEETGFLVPANDPFTLTVYIDKLLGDDKLQKALSVQAREIAQNRHNEKVIVTNLIDIYKKLLKNV